MSSYIVARRHRDGGTGVEYVGPFLDRQDAESEIEPDDGIVYVLLSPPEFAEPYPMDDDD